MKKIMLTAICITLCIVLPMALHFIPNVGTVLCPMHIPVLLCGLACGWKYGLLCGLCGPVLSSILTGMPPLPILPSMIVECATYGCVVGLMVRTIYTKKICVDLYISLIIAMLSGRMLYGIVNALIFARATTTFLTWAMTSFVVSLPAILLQLIVLPTLVLTLMKANLIPIRYSKRSVETHGT